MRLPSAVYVPRTLSFIPNVVKDLSVVISPTNAIYSTKPTFSRDTMILDLPPSPAPFF